MKAEKIKQLMALIAPPKEEMLIIRRNIIGVGVFKRVLKKVNGKFTLISEEYEST